MPASPATLKETDANMSLIQTRGPTRLALATVGERSVLSLLDLNLLSEMLSDRTEVLRRSRQAIHSLLYFEGEQSK